ncbi:MAG: Asp-tRNA(Asn)/Glu-tRNA(Gln) amidotransferase subunit GatB [Patescibacteria group bacterium]
MKYQPIIGLEIHIELKTKSKMFCSCPNLSEEKSPNVNICPVCTAQPGTLPVINKEAVGKVIKTGLALNCQIPEHSKFDRKSYFYPDLPKGYQISQYDMPFCKEGFLEIDSKKVQIRRIHLEEDTGKLVHPEGTDYSLVDFNRAGIPLMELVTEPDLNSAKEAREFAQELQLILRYLDVSGANMEKGEMRVEANISLTKDPASLGVKVEIKNLNSFRSLEKSIEYEIERQGKILSSDKKIVQETRGWDEDKEETLSQRKKEEAHDYRYFPEPDLPPLHLGVEEYLNKIRAEIPELPQNKRARFKEEYNLSNEEVEIFTQNKELSEYYEKVMSELRNWVKEIEIKDKIEEKEFFKLAKLSSNYIISDLQGLLKGTFVEDESFLITPENFGEFIALIYKGKISSKIAKTVLSEMFLRGEDPSHIIQEKGLNLMTDVAEIENIIKRVLAKNEKAVSDYQDGKTTSFQFLVGQVMIETKGRVSPELVQKIVKKLL